MPRKFRLIHVKYRHLEKKLNKITRIYYSALMQLHCHLYKKKFVSSRYIAAKQYHRPSCSKGEPLETVNLFV